MDRSRSLEQVRMRLRAAARRAGRDESTIRLIAVSKTRGASEVSEVAADGVTDFGENRVQEAEQKIPQVNSLESGKVLQWHLIGHLQSNKARKAVSLFDWIHSVDSHSLASRLDRAAEELGKQTKVLVQVDLGKEASKTGVPESELLALTEEVAGLKHLSLQGLMTLPPWFEDPELARPFFSRLRELSDEMRRRGFLNADSELSMGMSHDFEVAIEEGATMVRVGTAIFGPRQSAASGQ